MLQVGRALVHILASACGGFPSSEHNNSN